MSFITLHDYLASIARVINQTFSTPQWIVAELTDVHTAGNGHCYMMLIEKDPRRGTTLATVRGVIWANRWWLIRDTFLQQTGEQFRSGLKVMIMVQATMHEQYGLSLNVVDVDPTYTLGEMARRRQEIISQLEQDGVIDMNRELPFPTLPQRIGVISAAGAAGYGDFMKQLQYNPLGLQFYCHLFEATMQGQQTEASVIEALDRIAAVQEFFDVVVIIRGGGATVDLASFDSYPLAQNVANFPLPVITGIGHDRDQTVLDRVAHTSVKTPTAAAALLIDMMTDQLQRLEELQQALIDSTQGRMEREQQRVQQLANAVRGTHTRLIQQIAQLDMMSQRITLTTRQRLQRDQDRLDQMAQRIGPLTRQRIQHESDRLALLSQTIQMAQPDNILRRGFSITRLNGHAVKSATEIPEGAKLSILLAEGTLTVEKL